MIPDFKTYIGESVWNDIRRQSAGRQGRIEDDMSFVNDMNKDELYGFLFHRYTVKPKYKYFIGDLGQTLSIPVFTDGTKTFSVFITNFDACYKNRDVFVNGDFVVKANDMFTKLEKKFHIETCYNANNEPDYADIYPDKSKDNIKNLFVIKVIEFIMDNLPPEYDNMLIIQD